MPFIMTRTHGNAVMPETLVNGTLLQVNGLPYTDVVGLAQGRGKTFRVGGGRENWFHIPIPSVAQIDGSPMYLDQFFVFWKSDLQPDRSLSGRIKKVDAWDGSARIANWIPGPMNGDWSFPREDVDLFGIRTSNTWYPRSDNARIESPRIRIFTGLSISLLVYFPGAAGNITFFSAGASWVDSPQ